MEHATVTGKQGKDDNNIGSIITMLITDQVMTVNNILSDTFSQRCIFALEFEKVQSCLAEFRTLNWHNFSSLPQSTESKLAKCASAEDNTVHWLVLCTVYNVARME